MQKRNAMANLPPHFFAACLGVAGNSMQVHLSLISNEKLEISTHCIIQQRLSFSGKHAGMPAKQLAAAQTAAADPLPTQ